MANNRKFSALTYGSSMLALTAATPREPAGETGGSLDQLVEETRKYLISYDSGSAGDQLRHHQALNRAVLGYPEERRLLLAMIQDYLLKQRISADFSPEGKYATLAEAVFAEVIGLNVLELVMKDGDQLEEIQVVGMRIFEVRSGVAIPSIHRFRSIAEVERIQQNLVLFNQDTLHIRKRWAEVRLTDGARVAMTGFGYTVEPTLTIRFYSPDIRGLNHLSEAGRDTMDTKTALLLRALVRSYVNLVIIGATNSGKTQLLKALIAEMPDHERLVTIESRLELMLQREYPGRNIVQFEISEDDPLHDGEQAFKLALRQSPKRICHAEIRDEDANLYVRACTRGHAGSLTTLHASGLEDVPETIADMCMLDERVVNADRLVKRITEHVTQVGIELAIVGDRRKVVRIGEYEFDRQLGEARVSTLVSYDDQSGEWTYPEPASQALSVRLRRHDRSSYAKLLEWEITAPC